MMFYASTQVVVTGSNVVRKSGPRVGSLGFISETSLHTRVDFKDLSFLIYSATVYFYKYGYELRNRFEKKKIMIPLPIIPKGMNYNFLKNKIPAFLKTKQSDKTLTFATVSPVDDTSILEYENKFCAKIRSIMDSMLCGPFINSILAGKDDKYNSLYNIKNLNCLISTKLLYFFRTYREISNDLSFKHKQMLLNKIILENLYVDTDLLNKLFLFFTATKMLEDRFYKSTSSDKIRIPYINSYNRISNDLFKFYDLTKIIKNLGGLDNVALDNLCQIRMGIMLEGYKVLNLNKKDKI